MKKLFIMSLLAFSLYITATTAGTSNCGSIEMACITGSYH